MGSDDVLLEHVSLYVIVLIICPNPLLPVWISKWVQSSMWQLDNCGVDLSDASANLCISKSIQYTECL